MEANNKFKLSHVVLYAKGWYNTTDDIYEDLTKALNLDGFTPFCKNDVFWIITNAFEGGYTNTLLQTLIAIQSSECWKYGYKCDKDNYDVRDATLYYIISCLRFLENKYCNKVIPKYSKENPRPKNITLKQVINTFNK